VPLLFERRAALVAGIGSGQAIRIESLDFSFQVVKNLRREPNTAEIKIYNLAPSSRESLEAAEEQRIRLETGYREDVHTIFEGDLRKASSTREGPDIVTTIEGGDGERAFRQARTNRSFGEGTSVRSVIEDVAGGMGLGVGNLEAQTTGAGFEGLGSIYSEGTVVSGSSRESLTGLCRSIGLEWSVQDGNLQLLPFRTALRQTAVLLSPQTGLVGSPSIDSENVLEAKALIIPGIFPGRKVDVRAEFVTGVYRVTKATYQGSTFGAEWYVTIQGRAVDG